MSHPRPLSPHLGIYRWRVNMVQSTLHRLTGLLLSVAALFVLWGLVAAASGADAWAGFAAFCRSWPGLTFQFLWIWSLLFHLVNGIQHLVHDTARDFGPSLRDRRFNPSYWASGRWVLAISTVLTLVAWGLVVWRIRGGAA